MTNERWADAVAHIKEKFTVLETGEEQLDPGPGSLSFIEFERKDGMRIRLERVTRPVVLGKKTIGSRRIGSITAVQYQYSPDETTSSVEAFRYDAASDEYVPIEVAAEIFTA
ncbi:hypothetical protein HY629_00855 [Candidatus Uhrbacteria bacterium]|nr:hypothetical protein [Candidatus Uhrbacteria bacterium]